MTPENASARSGNGLVFGQEMSESAINVILENMIDGFLAVDSQWRITYVNAMAEQLCGMGRDAMAGRSYWELFPGSVGTIVQRELQRAATDRVPVEFENYYSPWQRWLYFKACPADTLGLSVFLQDITARKRAEYERSDLLTREREARNEAEILNEVWRALGAERDLQKLVQLITDGAAKLSGAKFGAFFYNVTNDKGESYLLYSLSGAPREAFEQFALPRNTPLFEPIFRGAGVVRSDDIRKDPRYGRMAPHYGMPKGHPPVRSYLAAPVIARNGEVLGGLFFGHPEPGKFAEKAERLVAGIADHTAVAIENAYEFERRRRSEDLLRKSEQRLREMLDALPAAIYTTDAEGRLTHFNEAAIELSGRVPQLGSDQWCVTWKLFQPDGTPLPHDRCPMATALETGTVIRGAECIAERPDGSRFWFAPYPAPLLNEHGQVTGGINMLVDITERKKSEEMKDLLGAIVDSSDDAIISRDLEGIITSWNRSAERLFGYTAEEAIGQTIAALLIPDDRQDEEPNILARLQRGERIDRFETVRRRKDGTLLDISLTISPIKGACGRIIGGSKIARDISERRRSEQAIHELNEQLKVELSAMTRLQRLSSRLVRTDDVTEVLSEIVSAAIEITAADMGSIQLLRNGSLKIAAQQGLEQPFLDFFSTQAACGAALEKGGRIVVEDVAECKSFDDAARETMLQAQALAAQSTPLVSRSGEILGMFSTYYRKAGPIPERDLRWVDLLARQAADLIERSRAVEALISSEARFRQLADAMPQMVWTATPDGKADYHNERWLKFSGLGPEDLDSSFQAILHPDDTERCLERWQESVKTGEPYQIEYRFRDRHENRWRWFMGRALPARDSSGRITKWFGTCTDIDEQKRIEGDLRRINHDLEQFAYSASHDLQEPLRTISIYSELLVQRHGDVLSGEATQFLDYLRKAATRMGMLVRDLLAYTQAGKLAAVEQVDANRVLTVTLADLDGAIRESDAAVTSGELPTVRVHEGHLKQLFQNLIGNAIKYRSPDRNPAVHVSAARESDTWVLAVRDNGIGIEPEYKEQIFGLFARLHNSDYSGTGIGLAICQRIVERYHGRIWVESEPGRGSTFRFTLPA